MFDLVAAVVLAAATPPPAGTPMPARMTSCTVIPETMDRRITPPETIRVSFMITGDVPADIVRFTVTGPGSGFRAFTVHGTFTKTIMIANRVVQADATPPAQPLPHGVECRLTYIHFVDGSSWSAPSP
jgi:hypothetical protein